MDLYYHLPVPLQNCSLFCYGIKLRIVRYNKQFFQEVEKAEKRKNFDSKQTQDMLKKQLSNLIKHVYKNVPFYRTFMMEHNIKPEDIKTIDDLGVFPVIDKSFVKEHYNEFIAENADEKIDYYTGGTTGSPFVIKTNKKEIIYNFAVYEANCKHQFGIKWNDKSAVFLGKKIVSNKQKNAPFWRRSKPLQQILFSIYHLNDNTIDNYISELRKQKPDFITGYASPVYRIAEYIIKKNLNKLDIKVVFLSSETLNEIQKETIEKAFQCKVCNGYSQAEGVAFIASDIDDKLHVIPDYGIVEFLSSPFKDTYEIVGTTLFNYTMPLIRYRTYDYCTIKDFRPDNRGIYPVIESVIGRDDGVIRTSDSRVVSSASLSLVFKEYPLVHQVQMVQENMSHINVFVSCDYDKGSIELERLKYSIAGIIGKDIDIEIHKVADIKKESNGKTRLIVSKV